MAHSLAIENKRNNEEIQSLQSQIILLQNNLSSLLLEKETLSNKLTELDLLIEQLLKLNESLITQLSGKPFTFHTKVPKKKSSSSTAVPSIDMIASEASRLLFKTLEKKGSSKSLAINKSMETIEQMKLMHKIYSDIARKVSNRMSTTSSGSNRSSSASKLRRNTIRDVGTDYEENGGYHSSSGGGTGGKKTRIKMRKQDSHNSIDTSAINNLSAYSLLSNGGPPAAVVTPKASSLKKKSSSKNNALKRMDSNYTNVTNLTGDWTLSESPANRPVSAKDNRRDIHLPRPSSSSNVNEKNLSFSATNKSDLNDFHDYLAKEEKKSSSSSSSSSSAAAKEEMNDMICQLEDEFNSLNLQYRNLLSNVTASGNNSSNSNLSSENLSTNNFQNQAEEIVNVIQKLHEKGEQLRLLKSPTKV
jgi:hypothetical protein